MDKDFDDLKGKEFAFHGVDNLLFKLGDTVWEAVEDESDGYRSYLECIRPSEKASAEGIFTQRPIARVRVESAPFSNVGDGSNEFPEFREFDGFNLTDVDDGHVWLIVGTNDTDDYYPCFTFAYRPKPPEAA